MIASDGKNGVALIRFIGHNSICACIWRHDSVQFKISADRAQQADIFFRDSYGVIAHNEIKIQWNIFRLVVFFLASWRFIISDFSEITFKFCSFGSSIVSPSKVLTGVSNTYDRKINISESGIDKPFPHLEIVCHTTFSFIASPSCKRPFDLFIFNVSVQH